MKENIDAPMHTAEHILNQTMIRLFGNDRCFSAHIEKKKSKCDYHFNRALTDEEIKKIENQVNEILKADLPITEEVISREQAESIYNLKRLPENFSSDQIRVVRVGDYDAVPCIGEHVQSTKQIGQFRIISSDFSDGVLRIRYKLK